MTGLRTVSKLNTLGLNIRITSAFSTFIVCFRELLPSWSTGYFIYCFIKNLSVSGGSHTPSADNYIGIGPFSEVETRELSRHIDSIGSRLTGILSLRSFGQRLVLPFAHTTEHLYNFDEMVRFGFCAKKGNSQIKLTLVAKSNSGNSKFCFLSLFFAY